LAYVFDRALIESMTSPTDGIGRGHRGRDGVPDCTDPDIIAARAETGM
jgi:hypothetical protein